MKLSTEFYKQLNSIENFKELDYNDPQVVAVRKRAETEIFDMERKRNLLNELEIKDLLNGINRYNLTPKMFCYLINRGIRSNDIVNRLRVSTYHYTKWKELNDLTNDNLYRYTILDSADSDFTLIFNRCTQVADYFGVSTNHVYEAIRTGGFIHEKYQVEKTVKMNPTLKEAQQVNHKETFAWFLENRVKKVKEVSK